MGDVSLTASPVDGSTHQRGELARRDLQPPSDSELESAIHAKGNQVELVRGLLILLPDVVLDPDRRLRIIRAWGFHTKAA